MDPTDIRTRKQTHLDLCMSEDVESDDPGFLRFRLIPESLPELAPENIDTSATFLGRRLSLPFIIGAMTGGAGGNPPLNHILARAAARAGVALALGSMRAAIEVPELLDEFDVRAIAPDVPLLGNVSAWQLRDDSFRSRTVETARRLELDGMFVHVNAGQELVQPEGERTFIGALDAITRFAAAYPGPVLLKEVGLGLSTRHLARLLDGGVIGLDVAGRGGTDFVRVEALRSEDPDAQSLASALESVGLPTAHALQRLNEELEGHTTGRRRRPLVIASGGIRTASDMAVVLALGADLVSAARPILLASQRGEDGIVDWLDARRRELASLCLLCGCRTPAELKGRAVGL